MKYIRTKDGKIIKVAILKEEYEKDYENSNVSYEEWYACLCFSLDIAQQANTIEELCDEFVAFKNNEDYGILSAKDYLASSRWEMEDSAKNGYQIYGAIWTDKGLIYVAKMNDKGELELL